VSPTRGQSRERMIFRIIKAQAIAIPRIKGEAKARVNASRNFCRLRFTVRIGRNFRCAEFWRVAFFSVLGAFVQRIEFLFRPNGIECAAAPAPRAATFSVNFARENSETANGRRPCHLTFRIGRQRANRQDQSLRGLQSAAEEWPQPRPRR